MSTLVVELKAYQFAAGAFNFQLCSWLWRTQTGMIRLFHITAADVPGYRFARFVGTHFRHQLLVVDLYKNVYNM